MSVRKAQQAELLFMLGQFFGPMLKMAASPSDYDDDERVRTKARWTADRYQFINQATSFCRGELGHDYEDARKIIVRALDIDDTLAFNSPQHWLQTLRDTKDSIMATILSIPVPLTSDVYAAHTPFSTYCYVRDLCATVRSEITWLDRYFDESVFYRYFRSTPESVLITLVTAPSNQKRQIEFMGASRLFAQERGTAGYRLIQSSDFHDRWLRCDDKMFVLGGSIKDVDAPFSIARLGSTTSNNQHIEDVIAAGTVLFGTSQTTHA